MSRWRFSLLGGVTSLFFFSFQRRIRVNLQIASRTRDAGVSEIRLGYQTGRESLGEKKWEKSELRGATKLGETRENHRGGENSRRSAWTARNAPLHAKQRNELTRSSSAARLAGPSRSRRRNAIVIGRRSADRESPRADWFARGRELRYTYKSNRCDRECGDDNKIAPRDVGLIYEELIYAGRVNSARSGLPVRKSGGFYGCDRRFRIWLPGKCRWGSQ